MVQTTQNFELLRQKLYLKTKNKTNKQKKKTKKKKTILDYSVDAIWEGISVAEVVEHNDVPVFDYNIQECCQRRQEEL